MKKTVSYDPERHARGLSGEIERLNDQAELTWETERRLLQALGVCDGQHLLELGSGPGSWTRILANWLPRSTIVGIDYDASLLAHARCQRDFPSDRITFLHASAEATGLAPGSFDVAVARYLLQHTRDPVAVATEARRVLKRGGLQVVIDIDDALWGLAEPAVSEFRQWHAVRAEAQAQRGGNRFIGRRLARILRQAGFVDVGMDVFAVESDAAGLAKTEVHLDPDELLPLVADGRISMEDFLRAKALHLRFVDSPDAWVMLISFIAWGHKP